jgi:hypothetical protein
LRINVIKDHDDLTQPPLLIGVLGLPFLKAPTFS